MYAREVRRKEILERNMLFREGWLELSYSKHAMSRLKERLKGDLLVYPKKVNISKLNINKGYTYGDMYLHKVVVRLEYKRDEWIFLVILPGNGVVKSLWFQKKEYDKTRRTRKKMGVFPATVEKSS